MKYKVWIKKSKRIAILAGLRFLPPGIKVMKEGYELSCHLDEMEWWEEKDVILLQYTGQKEIETQEEIYEGDVFSVLFNLEYVPDGVVIWDKELSAFTVEKNNGGWEYLNEYLRKSPSKKKIGNIHMDIENEMD